MANQQIMHTQNYSMMAYLSHTFVMSHFLYSTFQKSRIAYPATFAEKRGLQQKSANAIDCLVAEMTPTSKSFNSPSALVILFSLKSKIDFLDDQSLGGRYGCKVSKEGLCKTVAQQKKNVPVKLILLQQLPSNL